MSARPSDQRTRHTPRRVSYRIDIFLKPGPFVILQHTRLLVATSTIEIVDLCRHFEMDRNASGLLFKTCLTMGIRLNGLAENVEASLDFASKERTARLVTQPRSSRSQL